MEHIPKVILIVETSRVYGRRLLMGITKYARLHGPWAFYREPIGLQSSLPGLRNWQADGIIMRNSKSSKQFLSLNIPKILVIHEKVINLELPMVITNAAGISKMAVDHLLSKGLRNFAFCGFNNYPWSQQREAYFVKYLRKEGFTPQLFKQSKSLSKKKWEKEQLEMAKWIKSLPKPIGIMACNDDRAQHVLEACKIAELHVPEDVSVIGVDNDDLICDLCDPPLSSIALNLEKAGYEAAKLLDSLMQGKKIKKNILVQPTHVACRTSTDLLAIEDTEVAKGIRFIRQNFRKTINVQDVVNATVLSRRSLELHFNKSLSRSISTEIRRTRVEHICKILTETNLSISEIAYSLGFSSVEHISRYFKKEIGKSLREFRKISFSTNNFGNEKNISADFN